MELSGTVHAVLEQENISENFSKKPIVLETEGDYPQLIKIDFINKGIQSLAGIVVGDEVTVNIDIRGREWTGKDGETKYFMSINGWKLQKHNEGEAVNNAASEHQDAFDDLGF